MKDFHFSSDNWSSVTNSLFLLLAEMSTWLPGYEARLSSNFWRSLIQSWLYTKSKINSWFLYGQCLEHIDKFIYIYKVAVFLFIYVSESFSNTITYFCVTITQWKNNTGATLPVFKLEIGGSQIIHPSVSNAKREEFKNNKVESKGSHQ